LASRKLLWYLDSGCSKHISGDASQLINLKWKPTGFVTYGDHNRGKILGVGDIGGDDKVIIKDVLLVVGLKHNLLSISQLCDKGYNMNFEPNLCLISNSITSEIVLVGKQVNNVYNFCSKLGIKHNFSAPRSPQQNGIVERKNRSLEELARTLLNKSNLPKYF